MERTIIIKIEDSYIEDDTKEPQTTEDFIETVIESSALKYSLEEEFDGIEVLGITVK